MRPEEQADDTIPVTLSDILEDIGVDDARLLMAPEADNQQVCETVIVDPEDGTAVQPGCLVFLVGARGRAALPKVRTLLADRPVAIAIKGSEADLAAVGEVMNGTGTGLIAVGAEARWDRLEGIAKDRIRESFPSGDASSLMHRLRLEPRPGEIRQFGGRRCRTGRIHYQDRALHLLKPSCLPMAARLT